ncbi:MAG: twin transmembrane helix small protein [Gammaproteobacteria bacterium]
MNPIKLIIVAALLAIVFSLGLAFWRLMHDKGTSDRMVKALTARVILSIGLFIFLMVAFATGLITPHGF